MKYLKIIILSIIFLLIISCSMSNEEIIEQVNLCKKNKMEAKYIYFTDNEASHGVAEIICIPKIKKENSTTTTIKPKITKEQEKNFELLDE